MAPCHAATQLHRSRYFQMNSIGLRTRGIFVLSLALGWAPQLLSAQEFRTSTTIASGSAMVNVDLTGVSNPSWASITIRNSSATSAITLPQISNPAAPVPYDIAHIVQQLPATSTDRDLAIATWQFVIRHVFHYCSAGTNPKGIQAYSSDPILILNGFGFGCCDQGARSLAWIWGQLGYPARLAVMDFHTVPEIFYGGAWHMLDTDHQAYYALNDGVTIAAVTDILADPNMIVRQSDAKGKDPIGWSAQLMAQLYAQNASNLRYLTSGYLTNQGLSLVLRPHEALTLESANLAGSAQKYDYGNPFSFNFVNSAEFNWDLSFVQSYWRKWAYSITGVDSLRDSSGTSYLQNLSTSPGNVVYRESSIFPVLALSIAAQTGPSGGIFNAYVSSDGTHWSAPVPLRSTSSVSSYQLSADLSMLAQGSYTYFIKIELVGSAQLHRMRITPIVQIAKGISPRLIGGTMNQLPYTDESPINQTRNVTIISQIPSGNPQIRGLQSESLVTEDSTYTLARDYGSANLVDGDPDSLAYPSNKHLDYAIHLGGPHVVTGVSVDWGAFGSNAGYVKNWSLLGSDDDQKWQVLASGGFPGAATTDTPLNASAAHLRLVADGSNWIGAYEVRVFGTSIPTVQQPALTVTSNVREDPIYCLPQGYQAAKLIDGNIQTLAYPGSKSVDYQISLGNPTRLESASITWGAFGTSPIYVTGWSLLARNGANQAWTVAAQGGFPNSDSSSVDINTTATDLRLIAHSSSNWIGIYELQLYGPANSGPQSIRNVTAKSNVLEFSSVTSYGPASKLVDNNDATLAYPVGFSFDYTLDPGQGTYIDSVQLTWGYFGQKAIYIDSWSLLGLPENSITWEVVKNGDFPNATETTVSVKNRYRKLRVYANSSAKNWIGMYEARIYGY